MNDPSTTADTSPVKSRSQGTANIIRGIVGAIVGGGLGLLLFNLAYQQGYFMLALPGALTGLGCGMLSRTRSWLLSVICLALAIGLTTYADWTCYDKTLAEFIKSVGNLPRVDHLMFVFGVLFAAWFGYGKK